MEAHEDNIKFAGDYNMPSIILHNHANSGFTPEEERCKHSKTSSRDEYI